MFKQINKYLGFGGKMKYNAKGEEIPDPTKPEIPLGFKKPETLAQQVARLVKSEHMRQEAARLGKGSFEEEDDFDVDDDFDPRSPYEEIFDPTAKDLSEFEGKKSPPARAGGDKVTSSSKKSPSKASGKAAGAQPKTRNQAATEPDNQLESEQDSE